jgi:hypothetical protein
MPTEYPQAGTEIPQVTYVRFGRQGGGVSLEEMIREDSNANLAISSGYARLQPRRHQGFCDTAFDRDHRAP